MKRLFPFVIVAGVTVGAHADEKEQEPPKRAEVPFAIFVDAHPEAEDDEKVVEGVLAAREELEKKLRDNETWFRVSASPEEAEIVVDLRDYWFQQQQQTDAGQATGTSRQTIQVTTIYERHSLRSITTVFGTPRQLVGEQWKQGRGSAKGAARELAKMLEQYVKENYWKLVKRRKVNAGSP